VIDERIFVLRRISICRQGCALLFISGVCLLATVVPLLATPANAADVSGSTSASNRPIAYATSAGQKPVVARVYYTTSTQLSELRAKIDVWAVYPDRRKAYVDALLYPDQYFALLAQGYRLEVDPDRTAQLNRLGQYLPGQTSGIPGYPCYRTVEETYAAAQGLVSAHPDLAQWIDIGDSWEKVTAGGNPGYDLMVLKLTNQAAPGPKPKFFAMSSVHAREYTPAELNTRFAEYLINNYGGDPDVTWLLDYTEVHLLLQANPDGRKHAESGLPWRKNTNGNYCGATSSNRGADLNRNFPFRWNSCLPSDGCSSGSQCNVNYRGPSAASEPETQAVTNYVRSQYPDLRADDLGAAAPVTTSGIFFDVHSYSELVLWPWGFTSSIAPNGTALQTLGRKFAYFNSYDPLQAIGLYPTDGTTDDFAYGELGLPAFTFELGTTFMEDCSTFENIIVPNNISALVYGLKAARRPYQNPAGPDTLSVNVAPASTLAGVTLTLSAAADDTRYRSGEGEPVQNISAARYSIDAPSWMTGTVTYPLSAADGVFDNPIEDLGAAINTNAWAVGRHLIFIESQDAAGNWGPPTAAFVWITPADRVQYLPSVMRGP
jgi:murein tripeptide amidase MpaA